MNDLEILIGTIVASALAGVVACWVLLRRSEGRILSEVTAVRRSAEEAVRIDSSRADGHVPSSSGRATSSDTVTQLRRAVERWTRNMRQAEAAHPVAPATPKAEVPVVTEREATP